MKSILLFFAFLSLSFCTTFVSESRVMRMGEDGLVNTTLSSLQKYDIVQTNHNSYHRVILARHYHEKFRTVRIELESMHDGRKNYIEMKSDTNCRVYEIMMDFSSALSSIQVGDILVGTKYPWRVTNVNWHLEAEMGSQIITQTGKIVINDVLFSCLNNGFYHDFCLDRSF